MFCFEQNIPVLALYVQYCRARQITVLTAYFPVELLLFVFVLQTITYDVYRVRQ